jgi:hypothetical protein
VDRLYGEWHIQNLMSDWPFREKKVAFRIPAPHTTAEKIAAAYYRGRIAWPTAMRRLLDYYRREGNFAEAAKVAVLLAEAFPYRGTDQFAAYELLERTGRRPEADIYFRRSRASEKPTFAAAP